MTKWHYAPLLGADRKGPREVSHESRVQGHGPGLEPDALLEEASLSDDDERRAWLAAMAVVPMATDELRSRTGSAVAPTPWRSSDVSLTDFADEVAGGAARVSASSGDGDVDAIRQFVSSVETPELGKVEFVVNRSDAGLRIVLEMENSPPAELIERERAVLLGALRAAGIAVLSFRILTRAGAGTTLAQDRQTTNGRMPNPLRESNPSSDSDDEDERLALIG
jgi:hypothetical protein